MALAKVLDLYICPNFLYSKIGQKENLDENWMLNLIDCDEPA